VRGDRLVVLARGNQVQDRTLAFGQVWEQRRRDNGARPCEVINQAPSDCRAEIASPFDTARIARSSSSGLVFLSR